MPEKNILSIKGLSKYYPGVKALDDVSIDFREGEVHALIGENGAGKSTLIKTISGAIAPDSGTITINGKTYSSMTPQVAKELGVSVIYQEFNNVPSLSAAENVFLCQKTSNSFIVDSKERIKKADGIFKQLGVHLDPTQLVRDLSPAYQQIVEIAKAVSSNVKILIMDEPTAPLTMSEVDMLFRIVRDLKSKGVTILYISHRIEELFEICDRVSVLRDGQYITTKSIAETNRKDLISLMAGRTVSEVYPTRNAKIGEEVLRVEDLCGNGVSGINFSLHKGEILGFAGLVGAGRTELMHVIYGLVPVDSGKIFVNGKETRIKTPRDAIANGIGLIPEDRKNQGAFLSQTIKWNISINAVKDLCVHGIVDKKQELEIAKKYQEKFNIKTPSLDQYVANLSGGNQQKVVIAKTMAADSSIIIFDEPTRGIDVEAKHEIYKLMNELAEQGHAIIIVSSEMPELIGMSDRMVVIYEGRQTGALSREEFNPDQILSFASGGSDCEKETT